MDQARGQGASGARNGNEEAGHGVRTKVGGCVINEGKRICINKKLE